MRGRAIEGVQCVDSTGAGDLFAAGFLAGLIQGAALADCVLAGAVAGAAVVQARRAIVERILRVLASPHIRHWEVRQMAR